MNLSYRQISQSATFLVLIFSSLFAHGEACQWGPSQRTWVGDFAGGPAADIISQIGDRKMLVRISNGEGFDHQIWEMPESYRSNERGTRILVGDWDRDDYSDLGVFTASNNTRLFNPKEENRAFGSYYEDRTGDKVNLDDDEMGLLKSLRSNSSKDVFHADFLGNQKPIFAMTGDLAKVQRIENPAHYYSLTRQQKNKREGGAMNFFDSNEVDRVKRWTEVRNYDGYSPHYDYFAWVPVPQLDKQAQYKFVGDFNGDKKADIATLKGGVVKMYVIQDDILQKHDWSEVLPEQVFKEQIWEGTQPWQGNAAYTWSGDFDQDGKTDIASAHKDAVYMYLSSGSAFDRARWPVLNKWGGAEYTWAADFDGDGDTDIASAHGCNIHMKLSTGDAFIEETWK